MEYKRQTYADPTGGGDDLVLVAPVWANLPSSIMIGLSNEDDQTEYEEADADGPEVPCDKPDYSD